MLEFSRDNNLPVVLQNGSGVYDASDKKKWDDYDQFKNHLLKTSAAADLSNPEYGNTIRLDSYKNLEAGSLVLLFRDKDYASHVTVVTKVSDEVIEGYQGNFNPEKWEAYSRSIGLKFWNSEWWSSNDGYYDPKSDDYLGSLILKARINLRDETYSSQKRTFPYKYQTIELNEYLSHERPQYFNFNFSKFNNGD